MSSSPPSDQLVPPSRLFSCLHSVTLGHWQVKVEPTPTPHPRRETQA